VNGWVICADYALIGALVLAAWLILRRRNP
jgi:hypothetical protein